MEYLKQYQQAAKAPAPNINDRVNEINTKSHEIAETIVAGMRPEHFSMIEYRNTRKYPTYAILKTDIYMAVKGIMQADLYQNNEEFDSYEFWMDFLQKAIANLQKFYANPNDPTLIS